MVGDIAASSPGKPDLLISMCIIMQLESQPKPAVQTKKQSGFVINHTCKNKARYIRVHYLVD